MNWIKSNKGRLQVIGMAEGISLLLLLFICTPLKYVLEVKEPTKIIGMIHGVLFIAYVMVVLVAHSELSWKKSRTAFLLIASIIPFGTIYADKKVFKQLEN